MSRYVKQVNENVELIYGCDDYGYYYLVFDDKSGTPEDEFLVDKGENVEVVKFKTVLEKYKVPKKHIKLVEENYVF